MEDFDLRGQMCRLRKARRDYCEAVSTAKRKSATHLPATQNVLISPPGDMAMRAVRFTLYTEILCN
jgi:hypothetical protein